VTASSIWLFGYGSLMWDGWEERFGCVQRTPADLQGHSRIFNKKSLERWGTHEKPGLTLNLTPPGACRGMAFAFDAAARSEIEDYLCAREICAATEVPILLPDATEVGALTYIYDGPRLIDERLSLEEQAAMILEAEGSVGSSLDYIQGVRAHLAELSVSDPAVDALWAAVIALKPR
jgi:glutathione-specific gamma-glutamylcyclotransferase